MLEAARTAYVDGLHAASLVAAAVLLVGAVVALATMPRRDTATVTAAEAEQVVLER